MQFGENIALVALSRPRGLRYYSLNCTPLGSVITSVAKAMKVLRNVAMLFANCKQ